MTRRVWDEIHCSQALLNPYFFAACLVFYSHLKYEVRNADAVVSDKERAKTTVHHFRNVFRIISIIMSLWLLISHPIDLEGGCSLHFDQKRDGG